MSDPADGVEMEHGVEGRDLEHPDLGHVERFRDDLDCRLGDPPLLLLGAPQKRDHRRGLSPFRVFGDLLLRPGNVCLGEGEAFGLVLGEATQGH